MSEHIAACVYSGKWSSGMIPALGAGGRGFDSLFTPLFFSFLPLGNISSNTPASRPAASLSEEMMRPTTPKTTETD